MASSNVALGLDWVEAMNNNRWTFAPRFELGTGVSSGPVVRWPRVNWWFGGEPSQFPFAEKRAQYGDTRGYRTVSYAAATDLAALLPFELRTLVLGSTSAWGVQDRELILPGGRSRKSGRPGAVDHRVVETILLSWDNWWGSAHLSDDAGDGTLPSLRRGQGHRAAEVLRYFLRVVIGESFPTILN